MSVTLEILKPLCEREFDPNETLKVLRHNPTIYWSWGVSKLANIDNKGLLMKVNGHHHKGYVCINLGWDDTYTIRLVSTHGNVKFEMEGVYFDMLFDTLDEQIERIPEYRI